jgi:aromatic-L-amino-acid decarboxylase
MRARLAAKAKQRQARKRDCVDEDFARVGAWIEDYLRDTRRYPVLSRSQPGDLTGALPATAPDEPESFETIFRDFEALVMPGITHWNHPRFFAYFSISAAPVTILAEALAAALDANAMAWRTSPAATELEDVTMLFTASSTTPPRSAVTRR